LMACQAYGKKSKRWQDHGAMAPAQAYSILCSMPSC
jgi:hypothetical protein